MPSRGYAWASDEKSPVDSGATERMADMPNQTEPQQQVDNTPEPPQVEPPVDSGAQGESQPADGSRTYTREEMDARIKARIDKQNAKHAMETDALHGELAESNARLEEAQARLSELEHEREIREWAEQVSAETGVPASVIRGNTLEEMQAHATQLKAAMPTYPVLPSDKGEPGTPGITKEEIYQIKDRNERVRAMGAHPELFR